MALGLTNTQAPFDQKFYDRVLRERALPKLIWAAMGQMKPLKQKNGKTIDWRRFESLAVATTLTEGQTPATTDYTVTEITATVAQYGALVGVSDMVDATKPDPHLTELTEILGEQMGNTLDQFIRDTVAGAFTDDWTTNAGTTITSGSGAPSDDFDEAHLISLVEKMREKDAPTWTRMILPGPGINSYPVQNSYFGICSPKQRTEIESFTDYIPVEAYAKQMEVREGEFGASHGVRWCETSNYAIRVAGATTHHRLVILSPNAYGVVKLDGMAGNTYFTDFGEGNDYLHQRAYIGWKGAWAAAVLNDDFAITCLTLQA
jgi:N4-gp56 family major capsid protein